MKSAILIISLALITGCATHRPLSSITTKTLTAQNGRGLIIEGQIPSEPIHGEIIEVKKTINKTVPGACGIPFSFTIKPGQLHLSKVTGLWQYYAAESGKFTASFPGLGTVIREGDTIGIRTNYDKSKVQWYVNNSAYNQNSGYETIWTRALSIKDRATFIPSETDTIFAYVPTAARENTSPPSSLIRGGTGFAITTTEIATAYHLVKGATKIEVKFPGEDWIPAKVKTLSASTDVAILEPSEKQNNYISLSTDLDLLVGDQVFTLGFPVVTILGDEVKYAEGVISSLSGIANDASLLQTTVPVQPGNSGGPLVRLDGTLVGLITSTAAVRKFAHDTGALPQNINWAVKADYIAALTKSNATSEKPTGDRREVIKRTTRAVCQIRVTP